MRVISGKYKGRKFPLPIPKGVRPTADVVRESIFNILSNYISFDGLITADLCAGTGSLGIEVLSRGAAYCHFVEKNGYVCSSITKTTNHFGIPKDSFEVHKKDAVKFLDSFSINFPELKFNLIFCDPPYKLKLLSEIIKVTDDNNLIHSKGIIVAEHDEKEVLKIPEKMNTFTIRKFGETVIDIIGY